MERLTSKTGSVGGRNKKGPSLHQGQQPELVTNLEVMEFLRERQRLRNEAAASSNAKPNHRSATKHRDWIESHVLDYLESTPCTTIIKQQPPNGKKQQEDIGSFVYQLKKRPKRRKNSKILQAFEQQEGEATSVEEGFGLTDAEVLQILNWMPTESVEMHLMVDDLASRLSSERQEELLALVRKWKQQPQEQQEAEEGNDESNMQVDE